jgi:hypothetical protein
LQQQQQQGACNQQQQEVNHNQQQQQQADCSGNLPSLPAHFIPADDNSGTLPNILHPSTVRIPVGFVPVATSALPPPPATAAAATVSEAPPAAAAAEHRVWGNSMPRVQLGDQTAAREAGLVRDGAAGSGTVSSSFYAGSHAPGQQAPACGGAAGEAQLAHGFRAPSGSTLQEPKLERVLSPPVLRQESGTGSTDQSFATLLADALGLPPLPPPQQQHGQEGTGAPRIGRTGSAFMSIGTGGGFKPYKR